MTYNPKQKYAIDKKNRERLLKVNPKLNNNSGIYFLTREDEDGFHFGYIGQALHITDRLCGHLSGYQQHIDLSLKNHKLYDAEKNPYGWKVNFINYPQSKLDEMEKYWIKEYANKGYQLRNVSKGGQSDGRSTDIGGRKSPKGYRDGIKQGEINSSRMVAQLFDKHLKVVPKDEHPNRYQIQAMEKFQDFLELYKGEQDGI